MRQNETLYWLDSTAAACDAKRMLVEAVNARTQRSNLMLCLALSEMFVRFWEVVNGA